MNIILDECLPRKLKNHLPGHTVKTVPQMGWAGIKNGKLLNLIEPAFDAFLTMNRNLTYQQNMQGRTIRLIVFSTVDNTLDTLAPLAPQALETLTTLQPGETAIISEQKAT